jgi:hypothetical protein
MSQLTLSKKHTKYSRYLSTTFLIALPQPNYDTFAITNYSAVD